MIVCAVHIQRDGAPSTLFLDDKCVSDITAFLFHQGGDDDPFPLAENANKSFIGSFPYGPGFMFDDNKISKGTMPLALVNQIAETERASMALIHPFIGGEEINNSPEHHYHRYVVDFEDRSEGEARRHPQLFALAEQFVRPFRMTKDEQQYPGLVSQWWKLWRPRRELYEAIRHKNRVIVVNCGAQPHMAATFSPTDRVFAHTLTVIVHDSYAAFAVVQSRIHEIWARFFASSMKDDLRYTPSDCFETFPFPEGFETDPRLEAAAMVYYEFRAELMVDHNEGLTKTYNRFHDPDETSNQIGELRALHDAMDRAVLGAYGWDDLEPVPVFELEWEDEDDEEGSRRRKKPWRYRWPEEVRDEVLARLLKLNQERAAEEKAERQAREAAE